MKAVHLLLIMALIGTALAACGAPEEPRRDHVTGEQDAPVVIPPGGASDETEEGQTNLPPPDPGAATPVPLCADPQPPWVTDLEIRTPPPISEPQVRSPFRDPTFGACLIRVTDCRDDLSAGDESQGLKNEYARVDAFNADGSYLLVMGTGGEWFLYDAWSLQPVGRLPIGIEPRWDAADPYLLYYTDETRLMVYDLAAGQSQLVHEFAGDVPGPTPAAVWTRYEGRPSMDTRTWGLMAEDKDWIPTAFIVYDRLEEKVRVRDMRRVPGIEDDVDHVTISPLGTYFVAAFDGACERGQLGDDAHPCGLMVYDRDLNNGRGLLRIAGHYDIALDAGGREVVLYQDIDTDQISLLDLQSGQVTALFPIDFSHSPIGFHFSGLATGQPGWALISTYSGGYPQAHTWMDDQIFAVELRAGGRVVRLAHTHSLVDPGQEHDYWAEPHATVNRDFTRILFTSNWGRSGSQEVEMYLIELPAGWNRDL
jgi:hypothetical protein